MSTVYAVTIAAAAVAFGPCMLMAAVLWWPLDGEREAR